MPLKTGPRSVSSRHHWFRRARGDELWFFETRESKDEQIVVRHVAMTADGGRHRYSARRREVDSRMAERWRWATENGGAGASLLTSIPPVDFESIWSE